MKICTKCKVEKDEGEFERVNDTKSGLRAQCKTCVSEVKKQWKIKNIEREKHNQQQWNSVHVERKREINRNWRDSALRGERGQLRQVKLKVRNLINNAIYSQSYTKKSKTYQLLGCTYQELLSYLGPKPEGDYHVDHICPCAQARTEEELLKLQHYTNLRWLLGHENISKNDNWTPEGAELCLKLLGREWIF